MKKIILFILTIVLISALLITANRYFYGNWNIFSYPKHIYCYGRIYKKSSKIKSFSKSEQPKHLIYSFNLLTGKRIYLMHTKGEFKPTVIYLYIEENTYIPYGLSGGP